MELDGKNVKHLNVAWMRDRIGVVGQQPVLFDLSILENIRVGRTEVTQDEVNNRFTFSTIHTPQVYDLAQILHVNCSRWSGLPRRRTRLTS